MKVYIALQVLTALLAIHLLTGCSFKVETGWHGQTGRDDRVISQGLYPEGVSQQRKTDQRY
jgi:hypothetical protein